MNAIEKAAALKACGFDPVTAMKEAGELFSCEVRRVVEYVNKVGVDPVTAAKHIKQQR
jgi:hypothetical protein